MKYLLDSELQRYLAKKIKKIRTSIIEQTYGMNIVAGIALKMNNSRYNISPAKRKAS